jgi:hypothetical protein
MMGEGAKTMAATRRHIFCLSLLAAALAGGPARAQGAYNPAYDAALAECFGAMMLGDPEISGKMYDGEGFLWNAARDRQAEACMNRSGFSMPGAASSRIGGVPGMYGPKVDPAQVRADFREGMIRYGGAQALANIDAGRDTAFLPKTMLGLKIQQENAAAGGAKGVAGAGASSGASPAAGAGGAAMPLPGFAAPPPASPPSQAAVAPPPQAAPPAASAPPPASAPPAAHAPVRPAAPPPTGGGNPIFLPH